MTVTSQRYPLSAPDGQAIPLELIKPLALVRVPFPSGAFSGSIDILAYQDKILVGIATKDCYVSFKAIPSFPVDSTISTEILFIPAGLAITFVANTPQISVAGVSGIGVLHLQIADIWAGIGTEVQLQKR